MLELFYPNKNKEGRYRIMDLRELYGKVIEVSACTGIKIKGEVIDFYPSTGTSSGEDEIDIFPNNTNHIIRLKKSEILQVKIIHL